MSSAVIEEKTSQRSLAREISTFRRRSPPSEFSGPKFIEMNPSSVFPYPSEMKITSRSSPWTFSRFLTKNGSLVPCLKNSSVSGMLASQKLQLVLDGLTLGDRETWQRPSFSSVPRARGA